MNYIDRTTPVSLSAGWHFAAFSWSGGTNNSSIVIYLDGRSIDNSDNSAGTFSAAYSGSDLPVALGTQLSVGAHFTLPFFGAKMACECMTGLCQRVDGPKRVKASETIS